MIVLTRKTGDKIILINRKDGDEIHILLKKIASKNVIVGIEASTKYRIHRDDEMSDLIEFTDDGKISKRISPDQLRILRNIGNGDLVDGVTTVLNDYILNYLGNK